MSYTLTPYMVDLGALRAAVGSKDESLIERIIEDDPDRFAADEDADVDDDEEPDISQGEALRQLVMGEPLDGSGTHQYGYALEALCGEIGHVEYPSEWSGVRWQVMDDTGVEDYFSSGPPVPLPSIDDFPSIAFLTREAIAELINKMGLNGLTHKNSDLQKLLKEFEGWLRQAAGEKTDLVLFYY